MTTAYSVRLPLPGGCMPLELCVCHTPESLGAIVAAMAAAGARSEVHVVPVEAAPVPELVPGTVRVSADDLQAALLQLRACRPLSGAWDAPMEAILGRLSLAVPPF